MVVPHIIHRGRTAWRRSDMPLFHTHREIICRVTRPLLLFMNPLGVIRVWRSRLMEMLLPRYLTSKLVRLVSPNRSHCHYIARTKISINCFDDIHHAAARSLSTGVEFLTCSDSLKLSMAIQQRRIFSIAKCIVAILLLHARFSHVHEPQVCTCEDTSADNVSKRQG